MADVETPYFVLRLSLCSGYRFAQARRTSDAASLGRRHDLYSFYKGEEL
jgi:hypothetical protein